MTIGKCSMLKSAATAIRCLRPEQAARNLKPRRWREKISQADCTGQTKTPEIHPATAHNSGKMEIWQQKAEAPTPRKSP